MYKFISNISNISSVNNFCIGEKSIFALERNKESSIIKEYTFLPDLEWQMSKEVKFSLIGLNNKYLFVQEYRKRFSKIGLKSKLINKVSSINCNLDLILDEGYLINFSENGNLYSAKIIKEKNIWKINKLFKPIYEKKRKILLGFSEIDKNWAINLSKFIVVNGKNGDIIFQFNLDNAESCKDTNREFKERKVKSFLGIYKNELLIAITNNTVLAIDIETGELISNWRELPEGKYWHKKDWNFLCAPEQSVLIENEGKIVGLCIFFYWEIDLSTGEIEFLDLTDYFKKEKVESIQTEKITVVGDYIFFYSRNIRESYDGADIKKVVAFNRRTKKIEWSHQFDFAYGTFFRGGAPTVKGERLFVLNTEGELFIFEKEEKTMITSN